MSIPSSFSTICTYQCVQELVGLILSLSVHHPESDLYVIADTRTESYIMDEMSPPPRIKIHWDVSLDRYTNQDRKAMEQNGTWTKFQMKKAHSMIWALQKHSDVMFLDSDQLVVSRIQEIDHTKELGVSPHFMLKRITDRYGYYNGGMMWTNTKSVPLRWIEKSKTSRYFDQACIEDLVKEYNTFEFGPEYNIQSYRFTQGLIPEQQYKKRFSVNKNKVLYNGKEVRTFHTHFKIGDHMTKVNQFMQGQLIRAKKWRESAIIDRMLFKKWQVRIPVQPHPNRELSHANDSFRMYPAMWSRQNKDVEVVSTKRGNCWLGNSVMLYDRPTLRWMNQESLLASCIMIGNGGGPEINQLVEQYETNVKPWIFWPRDIEVYMSSRKIQSMEHRPNNVVFIGNYENQVQKKYRCQDNEWSKYVDDFHLAEGHTHVFTKEQYVNRIGQAKYGLCLRGFGSKCHREVELMGTGTVPIITPDVEIKSYADPPVENVHYLRVNKPEDIPKILSGISEQKWNEMSQACVQWFNRSIEWNHTISSILF